jgi:hypothetical protein
MVIYVGCSPSHASNLALILNPRTGHISPQFHVVFNYDFIIVQYLYTGTVPPQWADLVHSSAMIQMYTEKQVGTRQSIPNLEIEKGNFSDKKYLYPLPIEIVREWEIALHSPIAENNGYLLRIILVLKMRSITQLLPLTVPKINGICQHQLILTSVDYVALQRLNV